MWKIRRLAHRASGQSTRSGAHRAATFATVGVLLTALAASVHAQPLDGDRGAEAPVGPTTAGPGRSGAHLTLQALEARAVAARHAAEADGAWSADPVVRVMTESMVAPDPMFESLTISVMQDLPRRPMRVASREAGLASAQMVEAQASMFRQEQQRMLGMLTVQHAMGLGLADVQTALQAVLEEVQATVVASAAGLEGGGMLQGDLLEIAALQLQAQERGLAARRSAARALQERAWWSQDQQPPSGEAGGQGRASDADPTWLFVVAAQVCQSAADTSGLTARVVPGAQMGAAQSRMAAADLQMVEARRLWMPAIEVGWMLQRHDGPHGGVAQGVMLGVAVPLPVTTADDRARESQALALASAAEQDAAAAQAAAARDLALARAEQGEACTRLYVLNPERVTANDDLLAARAIEAGRGMGQMRALFEATRMWLDLHEARWELAARVVEAEVRIRAWTGEALPMELGGAP